MHPSPILRRMREGARGGRDTGASGLARLTPRRYLALAVAVVGAALAVLADGATGSYVLCLAFMIAAVEERLYGQTGDSTLFVCMGFLLLGEAQDWSLLFWLSAAGILVTALTWLYREAAPNRRAA